MKTCLIALAAAPAAGLMVELAVDLNSPDMEASSKFGLWKSTFEVAYETAEAEARALAAFLETDARIVAHNAKNSTYKLGHNEFSGMFWDEFVAQYVGDATGAKAYMERERNYDYTLAKQVDAVASDVDWVASGAVTGVKNQGQCGSCWSFSTTGALEGAFEIAGNTLTSLSEQNLVDCDTTDSGCNGGLMDNAFKWIQSNGGICSEADYAYTAAKGTCKTTCDKVATLSGHTDVPSGDEDALKTAVAIGPVSIAIEADKSVKNSWGTTWGESGYVRIARGSNICGIASEPSYPTARRGVADAETHRGDPNVGCEADELKVQIQGLAGEICSPSCTAAACPTDVPAGVTAKPQCALSDAASGKKYCALMCSPSTDEASLRAGDAQCGDKASCKAISGLGICTYDSR
ncbi:transferase [Aureococcus anophagefferens]|nr:transferase [Aureococcus anophagefferens]